MVTKTLSTDGRRLPTVAVRRPSGYSLVLGAVLILALAFYLWTAGSSIPFSFSSSTDVYNLLTTGFLHGHTYLPITPPPGLLHLADPYNPVQNAPYNDAYHDLSLYKGHFYSQWGPTPVLTLFAPFRITGLRMSESFAAGLYAFIGLVCSVGLLHLLVARLVPRTPRWLMLVATVGLALGNTLPFMLRRPVQYEVALSCGFCFEWAGLLLVFSAMMGERVRRGRLAWGSLCLGLAIGARPTLAVGGAVLLAAAWWAIRRRGQGYDVIVYALAPIVVCGVLIALYDYVRFGGFANVGQNYELAGIEQSHAPFYKLSNVVPGLFSYLFVPARLALTFPHAFLMTAASDPFPLPRGYVGNLPGVAPEPTGGILPTLPITLSLLALPWLSWKQRAGDRRALQVAAGLAALGLLLVLAVSWALFATTQRYEVDFATFLLVPAFLVWAVILARCRPRSLRRRAVATAGVLVTVFGSLVGTAVSFTGYMNYLDINHPGIFNSLEDVTAPLATVVAAVHGSPLLARVDSGNVPISLPQVTYHTVTENHANAWLGTEGVTVTIISPRGEQLGLGAAAVAGPGAPSLSKMPIRVSSPGHPPVIIPRLSPSLRMPISLHTGLNRIHVTLVHPTLLQELLLERLSLGP